MLVYSTSMCAASLVFSAVYRVHSSLFDGTGGSHARSAHARGQRDTSSRQDGRFPAQELNT